ncbi:MAG: restriction endonuclease subunit S [Kaistella sp.]|nr:restriction endonuclease subunit S [Kaistella sp.]
MTEDWLEYEFEKCLKPFPRYSKISKKDFLSTGAFPIVSQEKNLINGYWNNEDDLIKISKPVIVFGDHTKIVKYIDFDFVVGADGVKIFEPIDKIDSRYFAYAINHLKLDDLGYARHYRVLKQTQISFPSLKKQQQIVGKLDAAFELIDRAKANIEKNIQNANELFQSKLNQVFSEKGEGENFELKKLSELGTITSSKRIYKSEYVSEGVPFYRTKELKELAHGKEISLELYITKDRYDEIKSRFGVPKVGDILLSAVGTIGEILVIENENEFYFKDGNIVWFKDFRMVNPYYLRYLLITFVENIKNMAQGAAYSALTIEKINEYKVYFPKDLRIQQKIVEQLDILSVQTKHLQQKYHQKLVNLEELKKSILEKAFKGELL